MNCERCWLRRRSETMRLGKLRRSKQRGTPWRQGVHSPSGQFEIQVNHCSCSRIDQVRGLQTRCETAEVSGAMTDCTQLHVPRRCLPRQEQLAEAKAQKLKDRQPAQPAPRMTRRLCLRSWKERLVTELQAADEAGSKQLLGTFFRTFLCAIV